MLYQYVSTAAVHRRPIQWTWRVNLKLHPCVEMGLKQAHVTANTIYSIWSSKSILLGVQHRTGCLVLAVSQQLGGRWYWLVLVFKPDHPCLVPSIPDCPDFLSKGFAALGFMFGFPRTTLALPTAICKPQTLSTWF